MNATDETPLDLRRTKRRRPLERGSTDRLPPFDDEAEKAVLGCILLAPVEAMAECVIQIKTHDIFYDLRNRTIYDACLYLYERRQPIDLVALRSHLLPNGVLEEIGGLPYLVTLDAFTPTASAVSHYIGILLKKLLLRKLISLCTDTVGSAYEVNGETSDFVDKFESAALAIRSSVESVQGLVNIRQTQSDLMVDYDSAWNKQSAMGIHTGFVDLDRKCGGMMEQEMIVLAGLRSSGKTSLAVAIAHNVAKSGVGVGLFSLETSGKKVIHRLGCSIGQYDGSLLLRGVTTVSDAPKVKLAFSHISACAGKLLISDAGPLSPSQVAVIARRMYQSGARMFVLDYLQLLAAPGLKEYERTTYSSRAMKNLAKELNCPVIVLSSLSRESDKDNRPPKLSDLRASGQIEYDADKVWLLHSKSQDPSRDVILNVAKNKDGPVGDIELVFVAKHFRMESCGHIDEQLEQQILNQQHND